MLQKAPDLSAPLVLIVDDFEDARTMLKQLLRVSGYRTAEAVNGRQAVEKALSLQPVLVLMDLAMPEMNGFEATRRLKENPQTRRIPVIAVTGHAVWTYEELARQAGCDAFLTKPVPPEELLREIRRALGRSQDPAEGGEEP